jgi:SpoVK/Ycf46/Vps4 family AAA+-type ATPase
MAYRNLPDVDSIDDCYYLMLQVSIGLRDISTYLRHTIISLERKFAVLSLRPTNRSVSRYIRDNYKNATWVRINRIVSDERVSWKKSFREGVQILSPTEVSDTIPYRERIPRDMPGDMRKLLSESDDWSFLGYPIEILDYHESRNMILLSSLPERVLNRRGRDFWLFYIPSTYQWRRYRDAVDSFVNQPSKNLQPLLNLFQKTQFVSWPDIPQPMLREEDWLFLTNTENPSTKKQRMFVRRALSTPDFALLWGPPGSGKTYTIMELIYQAARRRMRVLFCASTHVAIDQALERLLTDPRARKEIVPLRIGESDKISTLIRDYQLDRIAPRYREEIIEELRAVRDRTESQDYWLKTLNTDQGKEWINRLLVDSANLVCGTTIGILQHPEIKANSNPGAKPVYDILIIDEASKTTFHEFLVPAQFAKRWVLCGDPRQLSPYVEPESIAATVRSLLYEDVERQCCFDIYSVAKQKKRPIQLLLIEDNEAIQELYRIQAEGKGLFVTLVNQDANLENPLFLAKVLASSVIICNRSKAKQLSKCLPGSLEIIQGNMNELDPVFLAKRYYFEKQEDLWKPRINEWEHELSIIMGQEFFTRTTKDGTFEEYGERKRLLLPEFLEDDDSNDNDERNESSVDRFDKQLDRIRLCAYPSVLELLVEGFRPEAEFDSTLNRGFPEDALKKRLAELQYQFRMHPEISEFPRTNIYDSKLLKDEPSIENERSWPYHRFNRRAIWIDTKGRCDDNSNENEARVLTKELVDFKEWASFNPRKDGGKWEVAVLSFYNNQVDLLHKSIQEKAGLEYDGSSFYESKNLEIRVGSVDSIQGREADIVFISFVRSKHTGIGFLNSPNRLNVAITRARYQLVLIGDKGYFGWQDDSELLRRLAELPDDTPFGGKVE